MKIYALADLHGNLPDDVPECDLLLIAGDICPHFDNHPGSPADETGQATWLDTKFREWLQAQPAKQIVGIWGNHDFVGEHPLLLKEPLPWTLLEDSECGTADGLRIYGTPYVNRFYEWAFMEDESALRERFKRIPDGLDILLSHGPPLWLCDRPAGDRGDHIGSNALFERLTGMLDPPNHVVCGHIHGGRGWGMVFNPNGAVNVWNVASVDETYVPHKPMWTEIEVEEEDGSQAAEVV